MPLIPSRPPSGAPRTPRPDCCVFCSIAAGAPSATTPLLARSPDARLVAFADARPAARMHLLVVPVAHIEHVYDLEGGEDEKLLTDMVAFGQATARAQAAAAGRPPPRLKTGFHYPPLYSVPHLHLHVFALPHDSLRSAVRFIRSPGPALWFATPDQVRRRLVARPWERRGKGGGRES